MIKTRRGQVMVLVLLLSLMGLTVGLATASRSLSDLKQISYVDQGTKAFAGAEAGLEYVLNMLGNVSTLDPTWCTSDQSISSTDLSITGVKSLTYRVCSHTANQTIYPNLAKDNVMQINYNNVSNTKLFTIFWKSPAAIEAIRVDKSNLITRYAYNPYNPTGSIVANNLLSSYSTGDVINCPSSCLNGVPDSGSYTSCSGGSNSSNAIPYVPNDQFLRIKALYSSTPVVICAVNSGNSAVNMPEAYTVITMTATTDNGTVKRLQVTKLPPALPSIFDYAIYSGGQIAK
ncbi:hypothetical protein M1403_00405 [Patescibacteria group bacterium]|nr:hypothetical protein [Patescibacteria group bacterium]